MAVASLASVVGATTAVQSLLLSCFSCAVAAIHGVETVDSQAVADAIASGSSSFSCAAAVVATNWLI